MAERDIFAEGNEVDLTIKLGIAFRPKQSSGVVNLMWFFVDCTKEQVYFVRAGDLADEIECFPGPQGRVRAWRSPAKPKRSMPDADVSAIFAQPRKLIEDCLLITDIEFSARGTPACTKATCNGHDGARVCTAVRPPGEYRHQSTRVSVKSKCGRIARVRVSSQIRLAVAVRMTLQKCHEERDAGDSGKFRDLN